MERHQVLILLVFFCVTISTGVADDDIPCSGLSFGADSIVCVCNASYCDTIAAPELLEPTEYTIITSNQEGLRFYKDVGIFNNTDDEYTSKNSITLNTSVTYQTIIGWGGAITDSAAMNVYSLDEGAQENLLKSYFSEKGLEYNLGRVPMGGTDFSTHAYSYDDGGIDMALKNFNLSSEDYNYKIPLIKQAQNYTRGKLRLFASTWIAPKWMKTNHEYTGLGFIKPSMYQVWANYFFKFLQFYKEKELEFWGITTGNEPGLIYFPSESVPTVGWRVKTMRSWIVNNLGPTLRNSEFSSINILVLDDQRYWLPWVVDGIFKSKKARNYVDGIAVHWYLDQTFPPSLLSRTHQHFPSKFILNTEASSSPIPLGSWKNAESQAHDIIQDLQHWVTGWVDWNIALDMKNGPTYINNTLDAPIIVNADKGEFYKQPSFYALGHFSKFIPTGSVRIGLSPYNGDLNLVALKKPDGGTVITILNRKNSSDTITIRDATRGNICLEVTPKSINTIVY